MVALALDRPRALTAAILAITLAVMVLAGLPSLWPQTFSMLAPLRVDTDPENMLSRSEPVRVFHNAMKEKLNLHDIVVLGVVNETHPNGVFNAASLQRIYDLTEYAKTLVWPDPDDAEKSVGVVVGDIIAPSTVDNIEQGGIGEVRFEWLMPKAPATDEEALAVRDKAKRLPFFEGTMVSENGKALAVYLPITSKDQSYRIYRALRERIATFQGDEQYFITGLPVANDTFGVEMFVQMAISAPLAMLVIFLLMLFFFRKPVLIVSPMILAMVSVIWTMGLLVITGNTVHIMSSMIPIFIMPIAVLDSIHILSEFFDHYQETRDRRATITRVMRALFMPMLYTSLTSAAGFGSLALTPIPPVQVFGIFVALGILAAWLLTILFIPAYVMMIPQRWLENFGAAHTGDDESADDQTLTGRFLHLVGEGAYRWAKPVLALAVVTAVVAAYGISQITINDNPTKWFKKSHPIRVADRVLNEHFGGTYMAYLALRPGAPPDKAAYAPGMKERLATYVEENTSASPQLKQEAERLRARIDAAAADAALDSVDAFLAHLAAQAEKQADALDGDAGYAWDDLLIFIEEEQQRGDLFKQPEVLEYMEALQEHLLTTGVVGKSNSLADLVKTVYRELLGGDAEQFRIPDSAKAVAQCLITYESSHRPQDLWHFVTPGYRESSIWVQLKSGDNQDMGRVVATVDAYVTEHPAPLGITHEWFGLTYINVVWQDKMVTGMLQAFMGSFLVVLLMMTILFRSALWGLLSMIPLTLTIGLIYGVIGLVGKDYDMPVAVLSSLTLGLAVDFAIHFLARTRTLYETHGSWAAVHGKMFGEPARAITRNVVVIAVGFLPLLFAPLMPYVTVGIFLASILLVSGAGTLLLLPALLKVAEPLLFPATRLCRITCRCGTCIVTTVVFAALVAVNAYQFFTIGWDTLTVAMLAVLPVAAVACALMSQRATCKQPPADAASCGPAGSDE
jgi:hypothetical protein